MADQSTIEWTDATWNPVVGCDIVSPGCAGCYAMAMAARIEAMTAALKAEGKAGAPHYDGTTRKVKGKAVWTGKLALAPDHILTEPLRWKRPRRIFVNSMGDLFHERVPDEWIDRVFAVMALSPQHTFQVLTKRSARMRPYLSAARAHPVALEALELTLLEHFANPRSTIGSGCIVKGDFPHLATWPLPNVWLGVSAERQQEADARIPDLLATPAAIRFVSAEPLLGPIDFTRIIHRDPETFKWLAGGAARLDALTGNYPLVESARDPHPDRLHWVIVGGESGSDARPMHPDWARSIRDQCAAANVPFFFKQWGRSLGGEGEDHGDRVWFEAASSEADSRWLLERDDFGWFGSAPDGPMHLNIGKKVAGRLLDGVEHNGFPVSCEVPAL